MMRDMREKKDMSQQAVAVEIGVERSTVAKWESGKSRPRAELLPKLAKLFGCSIEELLVPAGKDGIRNAPQGAGRKGQEYGRCKSLCEGA